MIFTLLALIICATLIYVSCEYFVNGVEWVGLRLGVARSSVGTVLAAFGTALPESVVTFVAVVTPGNTAAQKQIGVGAALGGPLILSTIAYAVAGVSFLAFRRRASQALLSAHEQRRLATDQAWFLSIFAGKVALGLVTFAYKPWLGVLFLAAYALYTWREMTGGGGTDRDEEGDPEPLKFRPTVKSPSAAWAIFQTASALVVIFISSEIFVHQLEAISPALGMSPQLTALLLSPVATELPETLNAVIWMRQGKTTLALGNISGAMMIQATVPSAFGIMFTPWVLDKPLIVSAVVTFLSITLMWVLLKRGLLTAGKLALFGLLYLVFVGGILALSGSSHDSSVRRINHGDRGMRVNRKEDGAAEAAVAQVGGTEYRPGIEYPLSPVDGDRRGLGRSNLSHGLLTTRDFYPAPIDRLPYTI